MAFSQATITEVYPPVYRQGQLWIEWTSSSAAGTWFQVYVARRLAWYGQNRSVSLMVPSDRVRIDVGTVASGEQATDFSGSLPSTPSDRAELTWLGGTYLDATGNDDVEGFHVYQSTAAGGAVSYATVITDIKAYSAGVLTDGYGLGGYGQGGYGRSASSYSWTSASLGNGVWTFGIKPYDHAGNEGTATETSVTITVPPLPPALDSSNKRLEYTYNSGTHVATLTWLASPG